MLDLESIKARQQIATGHTFDAGQKRPQSSDTLVLWDAVFRDDGRFIAYVDGASYATLFAHAPTDIAALIEEVERLTRAHDAAERTIAALQEQIRDLRKESR